MNVENRKSDVLKNNQWKLYLFSLVSLLIGILLMNYLRRVYFVGLIILFIIVVFQTPSPKEDKTGKVNDANISTLKFVGLNVLLYLAGGYIVLIFF